MDPVTVYKMGQLRQQEILEWAAKQPSGHSARWYLLEAGALLQRIGRKLEAAASPAYKAGAVVPTTSIENCLENC